MSAVATLDLAQWRPALTDDERKAAARTIEDGGVIWLPRLPFRLSERERRFLSPQWSDGRAKDISLDGDRLRGARGAAGDRAERAAMIADRAAAALPAGPRAVTLPRCLPPRTTYSSARSGASPRPTRRSG